MHWQEISWTVTVQDQPLLEEHFERHGALAISAQSANASPSFETWPGEAPTWERVRVIALFDADEATQTIQEAIQKQLGPRLADAQHRRFADRDWVQEWSAQLQAKCYGKRLWVVPTRQPVPADAEIVIRLDPGIAFGSGTHATTSMCLEYLAGQDLSDSVVMDYGCGSGILAVAALSMGAKRVVACDIDLQALEVTRANAERNEVASRLAVYPADAMPQTSCDLLVANILLDALLQLAPTFAAHVRPGGVLVLSGVLQEQAEALREGFKHDFENISVQASNEWVRLVARRKPLGVPVHDAS